MFGLSYEGVLLTCGRSSTCERRARPLRVDLYCCAADARDDDAAAVVADNAAGLQGLRAMLQTTLLPSPSSRVTGAVNRCCAGEAARQCDAA